MKYNKNMNLAILFCLLSLSFLSAQSLSPLSPSPSPSKTPVGAICGEFKAPNKLEYNYCIAFFKPYPNNRKDTLQGAALIANDASKQRAYTFIDRIKAYLSNSTPSEEQKEKLGTCVNFLRLEAIPTTYNLMHLIAKEEYHAAIDAAEKSDIFSKFFSACSPHYLTEEILPSFQDFGMAEGITVVALAHLTGQSHLFNKQ